MEKSELLHLEIGDYIKNRCENDKIYVIAEQTTFGTYQLRCCDAPWSEEYINPVNCGYFESLK